jgi:hypothetical protein
MSTFYWKQACGRLGLLSDRRGAVYVECLVAFVPVLLLFLCICQLSFIAAAKLVVGHAAYAATRSAIVVLEDDPEHYAGASRGSLSEGDRAEGKTLEILLNRLGAGSAEVANPGDAFRGGARLQTIRHAAYVPLAALAPPPQFLNFGLRANRSLGGMLRNHGSHIAFGMLLYNRGAAAITVREAPHSQRVVSEAVPAQENVTVRVAYLYYCAVPIASRFVCKAGSDLVEALGADAVELPSLQLALLFSSARFVLVEAEATLPNQGATYYRRRRLAPANRDHDDAKPGPNGRTVIGEFPEYIDKANRKRASYFDIRPLSSQLTEAERWAANRHFLDIITAAGDQIYLSIPKTQVERDSSLAREIEYLTKHKGYRWINQWSLVPASRERARQH